MAVDKMELLKRYKELKAQGVSITLMELKKQMEEGVNIATNHGEASPTVDSFGVNSATNYSETTSTVNSFGVNKASNHSETTSTVNSFGANEASNHSETPSTNTFETGIVSDIPAFQSSQNTLPIQNSQSSQMDSIYTQSSFQSARTGFSALSNSNSLQQSTVQLTQQPLPQTSELSAYSGNISESVYDSNYSNSFNSDFSTTSSQQSVAQTMFQPQVTSTEEVKYCGNVSSVVNTQEESANQLKYALIGYPLGHSLSSYIHDAGFKSLGLDVQYDILETAPDSLFDRIKYLKSNNYSGFNVTIPLKLPVTMLLDEVDISADIVGAVNTVVINPDKTMKGYNTDVTGFINAIPKDIPLAGKVAGVLGTGGAARAAITGLAQNQVKEIRLYTRNVPNSLPLVDFLRERFPNIKFNTFQIEYIRDLSDVDILVNTTPIGMQGRAADMTPVEENELRTLPQNAVVYDVIYNPKKTLLLKLAQKNGYRTINGVDMFIHQALAAEQIWTGRVPDFKDMKIAALENL